MSRDIPTTANEEIVLLIGWDSRIGAVQTANNQGFGHFSHCDFPRMEENVTSVFFLAPGSTTNPTPDIQIPKSENPMNNTARQ